MIHFFGWGDDAVLLPDDHGLTAIVTIQDDTDIVFVIDVSCGFERAELAVWIGGQWPSS